MTGSWVITVTSDVNAQPPFTSILGIATGGVVTALDSRGPVGLGSWERTASGAELAFRAFIFDKEPTWGMSRFRPPRPWTGRRSMERTGPRSLRSASGTPADNGHFAGSRLEP